MKANSDLINSYKIYSVGNCMMITIEAFDKNKNAQSVLERSIDEIT